MYALGSETSAPAGAPLFAVFERWASRDSTSWDFALFSNVADLCEMKVSWLRAGSQVCIKVGDAILNATQILYSYALDTHESLTT
jgi:hypothetical protein